MTKNYKIGHSYKDILSVSRELDEFVSWFSNGESGIGNSGGIRSAKYLYLQTDMPCYLVMITRGISHRWYNPWEDIIDYSTGKIFYWGDAKFNIAKEHDDFKGNKHLLKIFNKVLENQLELIPPILHFSKSKSGVVKFNGLCVLTDLDLTWFEDKGNPVKNYRCELTILDIDTVTIEWLHQRVNSKNLDELKHTNAPNVWNHYLKGDIKRLDVWSKRILNKDEQIPPEKSKEALLLSELHNLSPTEFEIVVVELFRNLPNINHKIVRTQPTADGGLDFYGQFSIPYPVKYEIEFLGEAKKFGRNNAVQPKHVSRLVARLNRGQYGIFVTTSYYTKQTQKEVLADGYPVRLFSGNDIVNILKELRLIENDSLKKTWLDSISKNIKNEKRQ